MEIGGASLTNDCIEFRAWAAATGNARSPRDEWQVEGMSNRRASAKSSCWCASVSAARWRESARYTRAVSWRQWWTNTCSRDWLLSETFSQCRSQSYEMTWSDLRAANTSQSASLRTDCRRLMWTPDFPASTKQQYSTYDQSTNENNKCITR